MLAAKVPAASYVALVVLSLGVAPYGAVLAVTWLATGLLAWRAIRARDVAGIEFEVAYPLIAWLCWVPNLVLAEFFLNGAAPHRRLSKGTSDAN